MSFGSVDPLWLVAGVVLHLCSQLARGRGWHSVICAAHPDEAHPKRREVLATWIAGAGASGVLSARGGDALRILLMRRHMTTTPAAMSNTKWLPVATTARPMTGAQVSAIAFAQGLRNAANSATLTASAKPACRLGTAASGL